MNGRVDRSPRLPAAVWVFLAAGAAALLGTVGCGGDMAEAPDPTKWSKERAEFERILAEWKPQLHEIRQLRNEYARANPEEREDLKKRYDELVEKGYAMEAALIDAAALACVRQPEENEGLVGLLSSLTRQHLGKEEYEEGLRAAQVMIDNDLGNHSMFFFAALSAYAVGEFELAEKHLQYIDDKGIRLGGRRGPMHEAIDECRRDIEYHKKAWAIEQEIRTREGLDNDLPRVLLKTNKGEIELELFENEAPNTVANFISLAEDGFYDGKTFFSVLPLTSAQAGCPEGDGTGGPGYTIRCEAYEPDHRRHFRGSLSLALEGEEKRGPTRDTGGSQFLIFFRPLRKLDGRYTVFGRVVRGLGVLARLQRRHPDPNKEEWELPKADKILEAQVVRKRNHAYEPKIMPRKKDDLFENYIEGFAPL